MIFFFASDPLVKIKNSNFPFIHAYLMTGSLKIVVALCLFILTIYFATQYMYICSDLPCFSKNISIILSLSSKVIPFS